MGQNSTEDYLKLIDELIDIKFDNNLKISFDIIYSLLGYAKSVYLLDLENRYSEPMLWIGMYIALASLCCLVAMVADLLHGLRSRRLWFPCKYFTINAASLTVIAVAMKLPVDLTGSMPGVVDQAAKLGSMAFMCTMMANFLPCLATMDNNELLTNIIALGVLVITLVVNVCIQIQTGAVSFQEYLADARVYGVTGDYKRHDYNEFIGIPKIPNATIATIYVTMLLVLLIIHVCSSLAILKSKQIIESKYQKSHEKSSIEVQQSIRNCFTAEKLEKYVSNHWIMAGSGSPQFIIACFATTTTSGVICALTMILHTLTMCWTISGMLSKDYDSDYKWSTLLIFIVQFLGVVLGTIAPISRCCATLSFKVSNKSILNHIKVFKFESYWTQRLYDWKHGTIRFPFRSHTLKAIIKNMKSLILNLCIKFQEGVVVACKIIALVPFFAMMYLFYCSRCLKWLLQIMFSSSRKRTENLEQSPYVLQLEDEVELAERTLEGLLKSLNRLIKKSEKKQPYNLMNLIKEKSTIGFQGVKKFDNNDHHVICSPSKGEYRDCWSLPVVNLTTIAVTLPNIEKEEVISLLKSVREGLEYTTLVEENLNAIDDYEIIHKAGKTLWEEVDFCHKWLGIKLKDISSQGNTTPQILQLFLEKAKNIINEGVRSTDNEGSNDYSKCIFICANSMSRITQTIIDDKESHEKLFEELSSTIADIMAACLTNLPQVIAMKCHTSVIEKRESSVRDAAQLLGETKQIINTLQGPLQDKWQTYLSMDPDHLPFIDKWRALSEA